MIFTLCKPSQPHFNNDNHLLRATILYKSLNRQTTGHLSQSTQNKNSNLNPGTNCQWPLPYFLPTIAFTYNQPLTTSKNHQDPKHPQKLQQQLVSLAFLLDLQLLPTITFSAFNNDLSKLTSQINDLQTEAQLFNHLQYHSSHITLQLISFKVLTKLIYLIYIIGILH
jgi:hypothetical protein